MSQYLSGLRKGVVVFTVGPEALSSVSEGGASDGGSDSGTSNRCGVIRVGPEALSSVSEGSASDGGSD
jgi:hypothetical protein